MLVERIKEARAVIEELDSKHKFSCDSNYFQNQEVVKEATEEGPCTR